MPCDSQKEKKKVEVICTQTRADPLQWLIAFFSHNKRNIFRGSFFYKQTSRDVQHSQSVRQKGVGNRTVGSGVECENALLMIHQLSVHPCSVIMKCIKFKTNVQARVSSGLSVDGKSSHSRENARQSRVIVGIKHFWVHREAQVRWRSYQADKKDNNRIPFVSLECHFSVNKPRWFWRYQRLQVIGGRSA